MTSAAGVSVVICAYTERRWEDLRRAVRSALVQSEPPLEVVVVIDHNPELAARASAELGGVTVLENEHERGLSGARNTALGAVRGEIIAFLDDDAVADHDWLRWLCAPYAEPGVIAVGGSAAPQWTSRPVTLPSAHEDAHGELDWVVGCTYRGQPTGLAEVRNLMGCNMSFRRMVFERVGGFDTRTGRVGSTPLGCEETELCIRARQTIDGARILFEPRARVSHRVGDERRSWRYLCRRCWSEGLSKAVVATLVGESDALSTEREYVRRVLPSAVRRELRRRRPASAFAVVFALACTGFGYLRGRIARGARIRPISSGAVRTTPTLSVVVPTAGRAEAARRCVQALLDSTYPKLEVLVVDNRPGTPDSAALRTLTAVDPRLRYVPEPRPGASTARNTGATEAVGEVVAFVDDDVRVAPDWAQAVIDELADPDVDCVTSLVRPADLMTPAQRAFEELKGFGRGGVRRRFGPDCYGTDPLYPFAPGTFGPGGCAAWRRETFLRLGGFNRLLGPGTPTHAGEDLELFLRLARTGGVIVYAPRALAWHEHRAEWHMLRDQLRGYGTGLSAMLCAYLVRRPLDAPAVLRRLPGLVRRVPPGDLGSVPHVRQLRREELRGVLCGPFSLMRSAFIRIREAPR